MMASNAPQPGLEALRNIASGLEVSLDWLVFGSKLASEDAERMVSLCARAGSAVVLEEILDGVCDRDGLHKGLDKEEWAAEIAWLAGEAASGIAGSGVNRVNLRVAEKVFQQRLDVQRSKKKANSDLDAKQVNPATLAS